MPIRAEVDTKRAEKRMMSAAVELARDSAGHARDVARRDAPKDTGALAGGIVVLPRRDGAMVVSTESYSVFVEYGTGLFNTRGGGRRTPWVYRRADGRFVTTSGNVAQPFFRPGFRAGVGYFHREARRRGM